MTRRNKQELSVPPTRVEIGGPPAARKDLSCRLGVVGSASGGARGPGWSGRASRVEPFNRFGLVDHRAVTRELLAVGGRR